MSDATKTTNLTVAQQLREVRWYQQPRWRRLGALLSLGLLMSMVTGVQGTHNDIFYAVRENFSDGSVAVWLGLALLVWAVREFASAPFTSSARKVKGTLVTPLGAVGRLWSTERWVRWGVIAAFAAILVWGPMGLSRFWQTVLVDQIAIYLLVAVGLNVVIGWAGMLDLGFIAFFAIGAYSAAFWTGALPVQPPVVLNNFLVIPLAVITCLIAGVLLGAPTLRLRGDYLAIVTLGFHEIVYLAAKNLGDVTGGTSGVKVDRWHIDLGFWTYEWNVIDQMPFYWLLLAFIAIVVFLFIRLEHSKVGRAWTAIREDEVAAASTGVDTVRYKLMAFAIGASTSGIAGVAYASKVGYINSENFVILLSILVLSYVIFGGMGSIPGVLFGAAFLVWLPEFLRDFVDPKDRHMYLGALLVVMMIYRPQGVIPSRRRQRELEMAEAGTGGADATGPASGRQS
ncbi:branched-chain amino acid ABC transporter permease [Streptomyces alkaliterrae]|uniref:Branched-chain amino acid ABC transporter permease n=1 Tax=Streptomyces alkaliterrae TaxID=2213162 RepID=A0A5P0YST6_9ACTN|nr:branched-chain amino acid ABC transporter permease [Streptomyces alkaliterrae]MBB1254984.1 branched-chain amino acid ABC transporter permease [Streptomyces alkaliterrae]MBB1259226.1 branched-chain amino acid ABC transporter permease [Streptomyces alkaliterrae]MQS03383.1 branched-chain amino acid ABC transporter permease [Streptomyces alkaliterrae]